MCVAGLRVTTCRVTDAWNFKPLLADAVCGYPCILRFQAQECLCPLNNVRLLPDGSGGFRQCNLHQLATPVECHRCVAERGHLSGSLHQADRQLSVEREEAEQPEQRSAIRGQSPSPLPLSPQAGRGEIKRLFFAGLFDEPMKGFHVLREACERLWKRRQDFELAVTAEQAGQTEEFLNFVGWQSQEELPHEYSACDICIVPTIAQEALRRTAVEAMAAGRPVIASRIGGLPFTMIDGATGLLSEPGNADDLAAKIEVLLDDRELRDRMGCAGRRRFEEHYSWDVIIERHYRPLLACHDRGDWDAIRQVHTPDHRCQDAAGPTKPRRLFRCR